MLSIVKWKAKSTRCCKRTMSRDLNVVSVERQVEMTFTQLQTGMNIEKKMEIRV